MEGRLGDHGEDMVVVLGDIQTKNNVFNKNRI